MTTAHFNKTPGATVLPSTEDEAMFLITSSNDLVPDTVRLPQQLGGFHTRVVGSSKINCPCEGDHVVLDLELEEDNLHVAECPIRGFLWYRRKED